MKSRFIRISIAVLSLMSLLAFGASGVTAASRAPAGASHVKTTTMGPFKPTFVGSAATGCAGCHFLSGPATVSSIGGDHANHAAAPGGKYRGRALVAPTPHFPALTAAQRRRLAKGVKSFPVPGVSCVPLGLGCDQISKSKGGATGVKGLNAVDSAEHTPNIYKDVEPPDQALCAGNGYVVEGNNIGEILAFNTSLNRVSSPISLDTVMGLTSRNWSSGGDPTCEYDPSNGGHWFIAEIVSASPESSGGAFTGCFSAVANECYEGIAVSDTSNPLGGYHVYYANADYNPAEPGSPTLLNDFAKIGATRDAFMLFYDEFPLSGSNPGFGGGIFNGAQEFAFNKSAMENGLPAKKIAMARENMGRLKTPDGTCKNDKVLKMGGVTCWVAVIPAQPADARQFDNAHGGTGFMFGTLDFYGFYGTLPTSGDNRVAAWAWTGLKALNSKKCSKCGGIRFQGQLFKGVDKYYEPEGLAAPQKAGPIPLGQECEAAGASTQPCPEGGLATNGDFSDQVSQAQGQLWTSATTEVAQSYKRANAEIHQGVVYWVIGTKSFDKSGKFTLTNQAYATAEREEMDMAAVLAQGAGGSGKAILLFTLSGNGGPTGADNGGFYPSTAFGRLTSTSKGLIGSKINIADRGQSPQDGFTEYQGYPGATRPRWGDYSAGIYLPGTGGRIYFANEYIQYPNCEPPAFDPYAIGTCGGTRDGQANWGTSVNYVKP